MLNTETGVKYMVQQYFTVYLVLPVQTQNNYIQYIQDVQGRIAVVTVSMRLFQFSSVRMTVIDCTVSSTQKEQFCVQFRKFRVQCVAVGVVWGEQATCASYRTLEACLEPWGGAFKRSLEVI